MGLKKSGKEIYGRFHPRQTKICIHGRLKGFLSPCPCSCLFFIKYTTFVKLLVFKHGNKVLT